MAVGYVYLMTNGKDYKIGLTASTPEDRMKQLQTGSSEQISLVAHTICKDMNTLESNLHIQFASKRKAGEWFALSEDNLHHIYLIFKQQSINIDMSLIPVIVSKDIDELMRIDAKRLVRGENTLHDEKYIHIPDYKEIVMEYMHEYMDEEEKNNELRKKERAERIRKEEEEQYRLEELLREDAKRIINGGKPLHTFEYKELKKWNKKLKKEIDQLRLKEERKERERKEQEREHRRKEQEQERIRQWELDAPRREAANDRNRLAAKKRFVEQKAKEAERRAGTVRTANSWKEYIPESEKHLFDKD